MVRLKVCCGSYGGRNGFFQFHYGTIKRRSMPAHAPLLRSFQFHYGTIKSLGRYHPMLYIAAFNSTMVRLKENAPIVAALQALLSIPLWYD